MQDLKELGIRTKKVLSGESLSKTIPSRIDPSTSSGQTLGEITQVAT
ncbi:hypothetical protein [uncultured Dokdonia sp.]|nr:hypothetical protein [uncultured Dokdonia sp.]